MSEHHEVVVLGGGTAGITVAARLRNAENPPEVVIVEPSEKHWYQPLWTLVGGGVFPKEESQRNEADFIPDGVEWIKDRVAAFDPDAKQVTLQSGKVLSYDQLVVALGLQIDWSKIPGLEEALAKPDSGVSSNYSFENAEKTWRNIQSFRGGTALFTQPDTPVKCGGAPQKIMYLAEDHWRRSGMRDACTIAFCNAKGGIFSVPKYAKTLTRICDERGIERRFLRDLKEIRVDAKEAVFKRMGDDAGDDVVMKYDMMHVTPPMGPLDVTKGSALGAAGWIEVDKHTLQHVKYPDVFSLGDCSNLPTSKTGAAIRKQAPTVVENLLAHRAGKPLTGHYDGYTSCPLVTGYGRLVLAEFDYDSNPAESFPFDQSQERYSMYALKAYGLPRMYWHGMLRGRM
jgi:sulfide:quinone oxidoreductase